MKRRETAPLAVVVTGSGGRIGRALRAIWGEKLGESLPILWFGRQDAGAHQHRWDIGHKPPPMLPSGSVVLHLAGRVAGTAQDLAENAAVTEEVCAVALASGAAHVLVMSSVAVYAPGPDDLTEDMPPGPVNPYGAAKLQAELAARRVLQGGATGLTLLRLANLAGADALLGHARPDRVVMLDPVAGQAGGPVRSYIGPHGLAQVLAGLIGRLAKGQGLPDVLNVALQPPVAMADMLVARGQPWQFGPPRAGAVGRVVVATDRLASLTDLPQTSPAALIDDLDRLQGWPG